MRKQRFNSGKSHNFFFPATGLFLMFALLVTVSSCKKKQPGPECTPLNGSRGFEVVDHTELNVQNVLDDLTLFASDTNNADYNEFYRGLTSGMPSGILPYPVAHEVVRYLSTDNNGNPIQLTGLLIYPYNPPPFGRVNAPIVSMNHGTELLKRQAPSKWGSGPKMDYPEVLVAHALAIWYGWIVIMPDYQGMGSDVDENHPYCVKDRLANATADMVEAAQQSLSCNRNAYVKWNGQTYLYGFSEGGYVTMVAARELEARNVNLSGVVCMDGPYDLSGTMLNVMLGGNPFPVPYFLPMLLVGYNTMYPPTFPYGVMLKDPYRTNLPKYTNGFYDENVVNSKMPADKILKEVFTDAFYDSLSTPTSRAFLTLYGNNAYVDWTPKSKMLLWHCPNDDCVPYGNMVTAMNAFNSLGATTIQYVTGPVVKPSGSSTVHVTVAPKAFLAGSRWIYHLTK